MAVLRGAKINFIEITIQSKINQSIKQAERTMFSLATYLTWQPRVKLDSIWSFLFSSSKHDQM